MLFDSDGKPTAPLPRLGWGVGVQFNSANGRPTSDAPAGLACGGLCFDGQDNLYVAEWSEYKEETPDAFPFQFPRTTVWWNGGKKRSEVNAEYLDSVSVGRRGNGIRLACSSEKVVEIWRVEKSPHGPGTIQRQYKISATLDYPYACLTHDGRYLIVRDWDKLRLFELFDDRAKLLHSRQAPGFAIPEVRGMDVSRDGRFAVYRSADSGSAEMKVVRIPTAETVLQLRGSYIYSMGLSPDGRLLAVADNRRHAICLYRVPEEQNELGGNNEQ
jgi:hypothetical protein